MADGLENRYTRNFNTIGLENQALLGETHVAVIGLGGLGGGVCELLARTGIGTLTLIDGDSFDASNLNRQMLSREDNLGQSKAMAAETRIKTVNSGVTVHAHQIFVQKENIKDLLKGVDLVVDCLDTIPARYLLQYAARQLDIPLVSGAIAGVSGQVTVIFPEDPGFEIIYPNPDTGDRGVETVLGNMSYCAMVVASLQASEVIKVITGIGEILRNKLLIVDLATNTMEVMDLI